MLTRLLVIFIFYYLVYTIKCSRYLIFYLLRIIICSLCLGFIHENNYLFIFLNYLFPVAETNYLELLFLKYHANINNYGLILKILS